MDFCEVTCDIIHETEKAYLIDDGDKQVWVPKSMVDHNDYAVESKAVTMSIATWIAEEQGLI